MSETENKTPKSRETKKMVDGPGTSAPKMRMRGKETIFHHLFRAGVAKFLKNTSWKPGAPVFDHLEHVHHYHSVNSLGSKQEYTTTVGGHFHRINWEVNASGEFVATCGPALKKIVKLLPDGTQKTHIVPVKFKKGGEVDEETGETTFGYVTDSHVHVMEYKGSDQLTADMVRDTREGTAKAVQAMTPAPVEGFSDGDR